MRIAMIFENYIMEQVHTFNFYNHLGITTPILGNRSPETLICSKSHS